MNNHDSSVTIRRAIENRLITRACQSLIGICSGIVADGNLNDREVQYLSTWLTDNTEATRHWPGDQIARRTREILADGVITPEERADLLDLLQKLTGTYFADTGAAAADGPIIPVDDDPSVFFNNMSYCFTGQFVFGTRAACERAVLKLGAMPVDRVSKKLNYLVIGAMVSEAWANTTFGRKIETAVHYRSRGADLAIISEQQWTAALADTGRA